MTGSSDKRMASAAERRLANKVGGRRQPLSGALASFGLASFGGDIVSENHLFEHKIRSSKNKKGNRVVSPLKSWIEKATEEAMAIAKIPVLVFKCKYSKSEFAVVETKWITDEKELIIETISDKCINEKSISIEEDTLKNLLLRFNAVRFSFKNDKKTYLIFDIDDFISRYIVVCRNNNIVDREADVPIIRDLQAINIKLHKDVDEKWIPKYQHDGDVGIDLRARVDKPIIVAPKERILIPTGLYISLPRGIEAQIRTRSGMAIQHGGIVANSPGTIDSGYRGEIKIIFYNISDSDIKISHGDRIAQMVFNKVEYFDFNIVDDLDRTEREDGGFGHTGIE